ncbi:aspartic peptidase A1 family [Artemisia annua]|uniref:Aspartic peptidase A1 family n=1 Tax=Artemisia annua TaxID=35608 RepID=A0A2U1KB66_ARTAN|nr:aspartic peptidase A1 family [Artemisia annua]
MELQDLVASTPAGTETTKKEAKFSFIQGGYIEDPDLQGFPAVTFYFENSLRLTVYPHDYLFHLEGSLCFGWQNIGTDSLSRMDTMLLGERDKFFGSDLYCNVDRSYFKNLVNKTKHVTSNIIDIWAVVLNEVEKFRSPGSVLRLFFTTQAMAPRREKSGLGIKKIQEEFLKAIKYGCERYLNCKDLSAVNLALEFIQELKTNNGYPFLRKMVPRMNWQN